MKNDSKGDQSDKNIIKELNRKILVAKDHRARYEVQRLQQLLDEQLEKNAIK